MLKGLTTLQVYFSSEDENRQKAGHPALVVQVQRESILARPPDPVSKGAKGKKPAAAKKPTAKKASKPAKAKKATPPKKKKK